MNNEDNCDEELRKQPGFLDKALHVGIIVHELAHYLGCLIVESKVRKVVLLAPWGGRVSHDGVPGLKSIIPSLMPFLLCNLLAGILFADAIHAFTADNLPYFVVALWLAISIAMFSDPSRKDFRNAWKNAGKAWHEASAAKKVLLTAILPFFYLLLIAMNVKMRISETRLGKMAWTILLFTTVKLGIG